MQIISNGAANIKLEITGEDLRVFSDELINRAINEVALTFRAADEERLLSREEVKDMCGVCDATLWHWNKRNYLRAVKVGSKVRYRLSDVKRILGGTNKTVSDGSKWKYYSTKWESGRRICTHRYYVISDIEPTDDEWFVSQNACGVEDECVPARP